ncbi:MAG: PRC-barrel domain containing protein [Chitinivibrionales bacterium]|nr:PRC-barrel domain containing protein [Chitinivibrionales bacterium]MBD3397432.1 PRC-barrel domain containing protein [Chitinivibrionales bacterium]
MDDFYFDDQTWVVRHVVADTSRWLAGRKVLLSTHALGKPEWANHAFPVKLTKEQVQRSPDINTDKPVSRRHEIELHRYYGWPNYWGTVGVMGTVGEYVPSMPTGGTTAEGYIVQHDIERYRKKVEEDSGDAVHLRSMREMSGYRIRGSDGDIGKAVDFIADDSDWAIRYLVVDTRECLRGQPVLVPPVWAENISWNDATIHMPMSCNEINTCPPYDPAAPVNRAYEEVFYDYYGRPRYWEAAPPPSS